MPDTPPQDFKENHIVIMKRRINRWRLLKQALKGTGADKFLESYLICFLAIAALIWIFEPNIHSLMDSLWYCFATATTIGFGDVSASSLLGRILTVFLSIYSMFFIAVVTAVITNFFMEIARARTDESVMALLDDLENLPNLSKEELQELSDRIKKWKGKE